jgi:catechol 2,3-dioxygenase-like lactoylglutathione lyase family enzyme
MTSPSRWVAGLLAATSVALGAASSSDVQSPPARPPLVGINHVAFRVSDVTEARRFYSDLLGLSAHPSSGGRHVYDVGYRQRVLLEPGLGANEDERLSHLAFETPDIRAMAAFLASRGTEVRPADHCQDGAIRVTDPDGHTIEFVSGKWPYARPRPHGARQLSNRLLHAGLTVRDEQAAHRFYRETLGFSEIWRGGRKEGITQWVNMRVPDGTDYLEYMLVTSPPDRRQRGVLHHMALLVPDIQAAWEEAVRRTPESGRAELSRPQVGVNGRWQLNLFDPDGTRTELMEPFTVR